MVIKQDVIEWIALPENGSNLSKLEGLCTSSINNLGIKIAASIAIHLHSKDESTRLRYDPENCWKTLSGAPVSSIVSMFTNSVDLLDFHNAHMIINEAKDTRGIACINAFVTKHQSILGGMMSDPEMPLELKNVLIKTFPCFDKPILMMTARATATSTATSTATTIDTVNMLPSSSSTSSLDKPISTIGTSINESLSSSSSSQPSSSLPTERKDPYDTYHVDWASFQNRQYQSQMENECMFYKARGHGGHSLRPATVMEIFCNATIEKCEAKQQSYFCTICCVRRNCDKHTFKCGYCGDHLCDTCVPLIIEANQPGGWSHPIRRTLCASCAASIKCHRFVNEIDVKYANLPIFNIFN